MFRIIYSVLLPFLTPFLLYALKKRLAGLSARENMPVKALALAGLALVFVFLFVFARFDGAPAGSVYVPPKFENGQIVPAHMESKTNAR